MSIPQSLPFFTPSNCAAADGCNMYSAGGCNSNDIFGELVQLLHGVSESSENSQGGVMIAVVEVDLGALGVNFLRREVAKVVHKE